MWLLAAKPWHFWIAPGIMALTVLLVVALFAGYLAKVVWPKTPRR